MQINIITIFPNIYFGPFSESIVGRAIKNGLVNINTIDLRNYATDKHRSVDDYPYGGGPGMLMKPEPLFKAINEYKTEDSYVVLTSPQGEKFNQKTAFELSCKKKLVFICGHYEGVDERVRQNLIDRELSIGDYVLTSGNLAAMVIIDSLVRLIPGVLGSQKSLENESFSEGLLEYPQYTKPSNYEGCKVPEVLLSGNHKLIKEWRHNQALSRTKERRPDLYEKYIKKTKVK